VCNRVLSRSTTIALIAITSTSPFSIYPRNKSIHTIPNRKPEGIEQQIVNIADSVKKRKLKDLDEKRQPRAGGEGFKWRVKLLEDGGPYYSERDEHRRVSDEIDDCLGENIIIKKIDERNEIDSERENIRCIEHQGQNNSVHLTKRAKSKSRNDYQTDINEKKVQFAFDVEFSMLHGKKRADGDPQHADHHNHFKVSNFNHSVTK
jgi:hypothetical protein